MDLIDWLTKTPFTRCNLLLNRLSNWFDNRLNNKLYRVHKHPTGSKTGCQTGLITGWMFVCTMQPVVQPVVQPVISSKRSLTKAQFMSNIILASPGSDVKGKNCTKLCRTQDDAT